MQCTGVLCTSINTTSSSVRYDARLHLALPVGY